MLELKGKYNTAKVFTDNIEQTAISQIIELCNQPFVEGGKIRIMPDCHYGSGCVIGFTADLRDKVIPNIVGVDIGCGMGVFELGKVNIDLQKLDDIIREFVPLGRNTHKNRISDFDEMRELHCYRSLKDTKRIEKSIGTLGGGNHFIEVNKDSNDNLYLVIHSGSRSLGKQVAEYYQNIAIDLCSGKSDFYEQKEKLIADYKQQGKRNEIHSALKELEKRYNNLHPSYPKDLCFLSGEWRDKYLHDMKLCQEYATLNRYIIADIILLKLIKIGEITAKEYHNIKIFETIHNYINFKDNIIRKGAISAYEGEKVLIPINMRDGSILAVGKGNADWNYSAPHGAGRLMSRSKAKENISMEDYQESMKDIFTNSVSTHTLDEAPMAYKPIEEIINNINNTVEILDIIKPIYNYKAGE